MSQRDRRRLNLFLLLCAGCVLATVLFALVLVQRSRKAISLTVESKTAISDPRTTVGLPEAPPPAEEPKRSDAKNIPTTADSKRRPSSRLLYFRANASG